VGNKGDAKALYQVAILSRNQKERLKYLKRSANRGYIEAEFELGRELFNQKEFTKSKIWLNRASNSGSKKAKEYLKRMRELEL
jgi:TPR repeat protein